MSAEKRVTIRPDGVRSKKDSGARSTLRSIPSCSWVPARTPRAKVKLNSPRSSASPTSPIAAKTEAYSRVS